MYELFDALQLLWGDYFMNKYFFMSAVYVSWKRITIVPQNLKKCLFFSVKRFLCIYTYVYKEMLNEL